jgi:hypothetical protein
VREEDVLAPADRIGLDSDESEKAGDRRLDPVVERFGVRHERGGGRDEGAEDREGETGAAPRRVDRAVGRGAIRRDPLRVLIPRGEPFAPRRGGSGRVLGAGLSLSRRLPLVYPRLEVARRGWGRRERLRFSSMAITGILPIAALR